MSAAPATAAVPHSERLRPLDLSALDLAGFGLLGLVALGLTAIASVTLAWMLYAWRTPESLVDTMRSPPAGQPTHSFSVIVPARHEEGVLASTLDRLAAMDHPDYEVLVVVGHDDPGTRVVAEAAAARHRGLVRVLIDASWPKSKPRALNTALAACAKDVTGVFDAEDEVSPRLLRHIDACFSETGADVVQGGVQLMNLRSSWFSLRNVLEYYFWFRSRLHFQADQRFIPLGGNTVFVRTDLLRWIGGWDGDCLAEDCDLGVRLSVLGARTTVAYDPELVTREETPADVRALVRQRTRWNQGFLQVLRKRDWRRLPPGRGRALAVYTLATPFLQAVTCALVPVSLATMLFGKVPTLVALLTYLPLMPTLATVAVEAAALEEFCRTYQLKARLRDHLRLVLSTFPYQFLLTFAALRAVVRESRGVRDWEKTAHLGAHRRPEPTTAALLVPMSDLASKER